MTLLKNKHKLRYECLTVKFGVVFMAISRFHCNQLYLFVCVFFVNIIKSFRFEDENEYEYEIKLYVFARVLKK